MRAKTLTGHDTRTHVVVLEDGEEVVAKLRAFLEREHIHAASFHAIGAFSDVALGFYDFDRSTCERIAITEQVEVLSMVGDVTRRGTEVIVRAKVVVGKRDGSAHGGQLLEARVRPTLEIIVQELPGHLQREVDPKTGFAVVSPD